MLQQYLDADVRNAQSANDVIGLVKSRVKDLIVKAMGGEEANQKWEPTEDEPLSLGDEFVDIEVDSILNKKGAVEVHFNRVKVRNINSERWTVEQLTMILAALETQQG